MIAPYDLALAPGASATFSPSEIPLADLLANCENAENARKMIRYEQYPPITAGFQIIAHTITN